MNNEQKHNAEEERQQYRPSALTIEPSERAQSSQSWGGFLLSPFLPAANYLRSSPSPESSPAQTPGPRSQAELAAQEELEQELKTKREEVQRLQESIRQLEQQAAIKKARRAEKKARRAVQSPPDYSPPESRPDVADEPAPTVESVRLEASAALEQEREVRRASEAQFALQFEIIQRARREQLQKEADEKARQEAIITQQQAELDLLRSRILSNNQMAASQQQDSERREREARAEAERQRQEALRVSNLLLQRQEEQRRETERKRQEAAAKAIIAQEEARVREKQRMMQEALDRAGI